MRILSGNIRRLWGSSGRLRLWVYAFVLIILLELTVFNCKFYSNIFNTPINAKPEVYGSMEPIGENVYKLSQGYKGFELTNLNAHVKNLYIDMEPEDYKEITGNKYITIVISATDAGNAEYFDLPERTIVYDQIQTKYIPLRLNGKSSRLSVYIKNCENKTLVINDVQVNAKVPFDFNFIRVIILFAAVLLIYIIRPSSGFYKYIFNIDSQRQNVVFSAVVIINLAVISALGIAHPNKGISPGSHQHQYHWLADAIMDGHFYLNEDPPSALVNMENPYDRNLRDDVVRESGESYKWDTAYYNGKYYVYFGIVPELLFFLPTRLLGIMIINKGPVIIMTMLAVLFGYLLIRELTLRWFKDASFLVYMQLSVIFANSTGAFMAIKAPDLYMIPISHALAFSLMGLYLWLRALPRDKGCVKGGYLFLGSLCMALVAGCRPQVTFASFLALPLFWDTAFKKRELFSFKSLGKTLGFVLPYGAVAAFIMFYNYSRFGSVFNFGASYNLTVMDMVSEKFSLAKIPLGIYTYFIQPPYLIASFPFLKNADIVTEFMGNYVMEKNFGGLFACHIILLSLLFVYKAKNIIKGKRLLVPLIILIVHSFAAAVIDCNTGGLVHRYLIDFMWQIFLAAVIAVYALYEKYKDTAFENIVVKFTALSFVWSMCYSFMLLFNDGAASYKYNIPQLYYFVKHTIEFWI